MNFISQVFDQAKTDLQTIILVENEDKRVLEAAVRATKEQLAKIILLGKAEASQKVCPDLDFTDIEFIDPTASTDFEAYIDQFYELRKHKGIDRDFARKSVSDPTTFGMMLLKNNRADGLVSGAVNSTANTLRPALQILKTKPGTKLVSGFFIMDTDKSQFGENGTLLFADCGLNENPDAEQLAEIALSTADTFRFFMHKEPVVAMLSYSTKGSAHSPLTEKVAEATRLAQAKAPELKLDGEIQADAAIVPRISERKAPGNKVGGKANVLVFPDLNAGNIAYKLVQQFSDAKAYGPLLQGIAKPVNDLSRGCSMEDILGVIALTCVQAQAAQ